MPAISIRVLQALPSDFRATLEISLPSGMTPRNDTPNRAARPVFFRLFPAAEMACVDGSAVVPRTLT